MKKLGEGTHGSVYTLDNRRVSKRTLILDKRSIGVYLSDGCLPEMVALKRASTMGCRHLVRPLEWKVFDGKSELILERLEPLDADLISQKGKKFASHIFEALYDLHQAEIMHSDLKMDNIMYRPSTDEAVIIDLGLSKMDISVRPPDKARFTFDYRPPEVLLGTHNADLEKTDIWAAGICAVSILLGYAKRSVFYKPMYEEDWCGSLEYILDSLECDKFPRSSDLVLLPKYQEFISSCDRMDVDDGKESPRSLVGQMRILYGRVGVDWLKGVLAISPKHRFTALDALKHPFLAGISECSKSNMPDVIGAFPTPPKHLPQYPIPKSVFSEIVTACNERDMCFETAFKAFDLLAIIPNSADPVAVAAAVLVASSVVESKLIDMNDLFDTMVSWAPTKVRIDAVETLVACTGVLTVLASHSAFYIACKLARGQRIGLPKTEREIAWALVNKYIERGGIRPKSIDILDCI